MQVVYVCSLLLVVVFTVYGFGWRAPATRETQQFKSASSSLQMSNGNKAMKTMIASSFAAVFLGLNPGDMIIPQPVVAQSFSIAANIVSSSVFQGNYADPNHPGCLRQVTVSGKDVTIVGSDSTDGSNKWTISAREEESGKILVDFSPKGGPKDLLGIMIDSC